MKQTLLEKAKSFASRPAARYDKEMFDLAAAWVKRDITLAQLNQALGKRKTNNSLVSIAYCVREMYEKGMITIARGQGA